MVSQGDRRRPPVGATIDQLIARSMGGIEGRRANLFMYDVIMTYIFVVSSEI